MVDHEHTEPENEPQKDQPKKDWTEEQYPLVDADFVGDTLERVLHDQDEIADEASQVEVIHFDHALLENYCVPDASGDFVESTLQRVKDQFDCGISTPNADAAEFEDLVHTSDVPPADAEFVDRCLQAVLADREERAINASNRPWSRPLTLMTSIAAIVLCGVSIFWGFFSGDEPRSTDVREPIAATPVVAWAALLSASEPRDDDDFELLAPLEQTLGWTEEVR